MPVAVGIGFFAVLFAALWGAAALISSNSDDTTERLAPSFQEMGSYTALASVIADGGPIILPDLVGTDRHIVLDHTGAEPDSGWTIHLAHPADRDAACQIEQIKHTRQFVDCDGRTLEVDDLAEPPRGVGPIVDRDSGLLTLSLRATPTSTTPTTTSVTTTSVTPPTT